ncbi:hypothetical protein [Salinibaculum rarum]|uniref:hypothetical protein n=1 Tax=Salinibaculum rarum TaxID=3058903 RepID=UPI00265DF225|nr:hypothetical protein [Salinibaculum sp. KK48]
MGVAERSRDQVEDKLGDLHETYGSFSIKQTTITLPGEQYASMRNGAEPAQVSAYAAVRNDDDDEILHVEGEREPELPGVELPIDESLEPAICEHVQQEAGVDCVVEDVQHVTIAGLRCRDDPDAATLYNLVVVFSGRHETGVPAESASWRQLDEQIQPAYA